MNAWRGVILQMGCLAALVALVRGNTDEKILYVAVGGVLSALAQTISRARVDVAGEPRTPPKAGGGPGLSLPPIIGAIVTLFLLGTILQ